MIKSASAIVLYLWRDYLQLELKLKQVITQLCNSLLEIGVKRYFLLIIVCGKFPSKLMDIIEYLSVRISNITGLMHERCNSIANTLELHFYCTNPSICTSISMFIATIPCGFIITSIFCKIFKSHLTIDRWIPLTKGQLRRNCFHLIMSSWWGAICEFKVHLLLP